MNQSIFIERCVTGKRTKPGTYSNIYFDGSTLYSYGKHYPLLIDLGGGLKVVNTQGYSISTSKHISRCYKYAQIDCHVIGRSLYGWYGSYHEDSRQNSNLTDSDFIVRRKAVAYFLLLEEKELKEKLSKLTKRATRQIPQTQYRLAEIAKNLKALTLYPITK